MKTLYLIGNGFDRAHCLPTNYVDFRNYLEKNHEDFLTRFEEMYGVLTYDELDWKSSEEGKEKWEKSVEKNLWSTFEEEIGHPDEDSMYAEADAMDGTLREFGIKDTLDYHWKERYGFVSQLQRYVLEWVETIDTSNVKPRKSELIGNNTDYFLSFNYTDTLERVYGIKNVLHIHGAVPSCSDVAPIMGHGNQRMIRENLQRAKECMQDGVELYASIYQAIAEFGQSLYKNYNEIIEKNSGFFDRLQDVDKVVCVGISFGDVDIPYLVKIMDAVSPQTQWTGYYFNDTAKARLESVFGIIGISHKFETFIRNVNNFWNMECG